MTLFSVARFPLGIVG